MPVAIDAPIALGIGRDVDARSPARPAAPPRAPSARSGPSAAPTCGRSSRSGRSPSARRRSGPGSPSWSNCVIGPAPDSPATSARQLVSASLPSERDHPDPGDRRPAVAVLPFSLALTYIPSPPSTSSTSPVMNEASSEQRNRTARRRPPARRAGRAACSRASPPSPPRGARRSAASSRSPGAIDVRAHAARAELAGERLREADDPGLRRRRSSSGRSCRAGRRSS